MAPTISGTPSPSVIIGNDYLFQPNAADSDGDELTFTVSGLPPWASLDPVSGQVTGMPQPGDEGFYDNIVISVGDGQTTSSLDPFSINVVQAGTGSVTLTWTPPTQNTDGSSLDDLVAYKFYYGPESGNYTSEIRIDNPGLSTYVVDGLSPATYFFVATVVNSQNIESTFSNEASATVTSN
jgi:hypothetical protein